MPDQPKFAENPPPSGDIGDQLFGKFANALAGKFLGDVPEADKASILEDLVDTLDELTAINRNFAAIVWDKFGDEETGDLKRKPDLRDFLVAWNLATLQFMGEQEEGSGGENGEEGFEDDDFGEDGGPEAPPPGPGPVVDADYEVLRTKSGKKA